MPFLSSHFSTSSSSSLRAFLQFLSLLPFLTEKHGWVAEMEARPHGEAAEETGGGCGIGLRAGLEVVAGRTEHGRYDVVTGGGRGDQLGSAVMERTTASGW